MGGEGLIPGLYKLYTGYKEFQQKQEKEGRTNFMEQLAANQSVHPKDTGMNLTDEEAGKAKKYGIHLNDLRQAGAPEQGQPAQPAPADQPAQGQQQSSPDGLVQPAPLQAPMQQLRQAGQPQQQNPVMKILHGLTGGGQQQQQAPQQVNYPSKGFATLNEQTGEVSPTRYIGANTDLIKTNATPKGITWLVSPDGKQEYQGHEGDPKTAELLQQGWQTQTKYGTDQGRIQHEQDFQQRERDIQANAQAGRDSRESMADAVRGAAGKPNAQQQAAVDAFVEDKGRKPTKKELNDIYSSAASGPSSYANWTPEEKESAIKDRILTGKPITVAFGDRSSRNAAEEDYRRYLTAKGIDPSEVQAIQGKVKADQGSLKKNEDRLAATEQFSNTVKSNSAEMLRLRAQYGKEWPKLVSQAANHIKQGTVGDGDIAALQFAMLSLSQEAAKVESGSLGVAAPLGETSKQLYDIMNYNYKTTDLEKLFSTVNKFADMRKKAIEDESATLEGKIQDPGNYKKKTGAGGAGSATKAGGTDTPTEIVNPTMGQKMRLNAEGTAWEVVK
jgi:hypothetical protein